MDTVVQINFTHLKQAKTSDIKILLLFEPNEEVVDMWVRVGKMFVEGVLPDAAGKIAKTSKVKRKNLF